MKKSAKLGLGCLALMTLSSVVGMVLFWKVLLPAIVPYADSNIVLLVETAIVDFTARNPGQVPEVGTNEAWAAILKDREIAGVRLRLFVQQGKLVNLMRVPLKIQSGGISRITVVSAGPDKIMGTGDDIDAEKARQVLEEWEAARNR